MRASSSIFFAVGSGNKFYKVSTSHLHTGQMARLTYAQRHCQCSQFVTSLCFPLGSYLGTTNAFQSFQESKTHIFNLHTSRKLKKRKTPKAPKQAPTPTRTSQPPKVPFLPLPLPFHLRRRQRSNPTSSANTIHTPLMTPQHRHTLPFVLRRALPYPY